MSFIEDLLHLGHESDPPPLESLHLELPGLGVVLLDTVGGGRAVLHLLQIVQLFIISFMIQIIIDCLKDSLQYYIKS